MTRRLLLGYLGITMLVLVLLGVPLGVTFARSERDELVADVRRDAESIARFATGPLGADRPGRLPEVAAAYEDTTGGRVVVVDAEGRSVADSADEPGRSFRSRPEVADALDGEERSGFRTSDTLDRRLLFVAVPVDPGGRVIGAVRVTYPATVADERIQQTWFILGGVAAVVLAAVAALGWWLARSLSRPIRDVEDAARRLGQGDLGARAPVPKGPPELERLAREVNDAGERIEQLVGAQGAFVADASHQLRTPLTALRLRLEMLEDGCAPEAADDLAASLAEVHRLTRILDGLLTIARADQHGPAVQPLDVGAVVEGRRDAWAPLAAEREVELVCRAGSVWALATPGHLEQVLDNLIANALDVSPTGSRIWLRAAAESDRVAIHVSDEGPGMDADRRARAFDRFWRESEGNGRGFGLGLAIAHRLVTNDGGRLELLEAGTGGLDARISLRPAPGR